MLKIRLCPIPLTMHMYREAIRVKNLLIITCKEKKIRF